MVSDIDRFVATIERDLETLACARPENLAPHVLKIENIQDNAYRALEKARHAKENYHG